MTLRTELGLCHGLWMYVSSSHDMAHKTKVGKTQKQEPQIFKQPHHILLPTRQKSE